MTINALNLARHQRIGVCNLNFGTTRLYSGEFQASAALPAGKESSGEEKNPFSTGNSKPAINRYLMEITVTNPYVPYGGLLESNLHYCAFKTSLHGRHHQPVT
jgi:hypothetical protein